MIKDLPSIHFSIIAPNMVMITRSNDLWVRLGFKFTSPPFHTRLSTLFEDLEFYNISKTKSTKVSFLQRVRTEKAGKSTYKWPQGSVASQPRNLELILVCQYNSSQSGWMSYSWERWITPFRKVSWGSALGCSHHLLFADSTCWICTYDESMIHMCQRHLWQVVSILFLADIVKAKQHRDVECTQRICC